MENLAAFNAREVMRAASEEKKERSITLQKTNECQSKRQSRPNELSQNCRKKAVRWSGRVKKGG